MDRKFAVELLKSAAREYESLPRREKRQVTEAINALESDPYPPGFAKLQGYAGFRLRVGRNRVLYLVNKSARRVTVVRIGPRKDVYRRLERLLPN
jgi:mRNA interferase RelE/StbE